MKIGSVREVMEDETRAGLIPKHAREAEQCGHKILVESFLGEKSGFKNSNYAGSDASVCLGEDVWSEAELVVKVKQPQPEEFKHFRKGLVVCCFFHLAAQKPLLEALLQSGVTAVDFGTIARPDSGTHILAKMSEIAGRIAFFEGAKLLMDHKGIMLGPHATALVLGLGNAGTAAARLLTSSGTLTYAMDSDPERVKNFKTRFHTLYGYQYDPSFLEKMFPALGLVIGATHKVGELQKKVVTESMIKSMEPGSVLIDIAIDMGGCFQTSSQTSLQEPTFIEHGVVHYCVPNMPAKVPKEATLALANESFPYILDIANKGFKRAALENPALAKGVNTHRGWITHEGLAKSIGRMKDYKPLLEVL